jgi:uncharacterized membrane protein YeaQ/YmgE (transglycosylase-associated protein family)
VSIIHPSSLSIVHIVILGTIAGVIAQLLAPKSKKLLRFVAGPLIGILGGILATFITAVARLFADCGDQSDRPGGRRDCAAGFVILLLAAANDTAFWTISPRA